LRYNLVSDTLTGDITATRDPMLKRDEVTFDTHVKNIYRTLLTRGMKGCYVYFTDKGTEEFFRNRMEKNIDQVESLLQ
jgi:DUF2075 family protein